MDKIQIIQNAEQYISKDLLYGFYNGQPFKKFIETNAERIVQEDDTSDLVVRKLLEVVDQLIDKNMFTKAYENISTTTDIESFINNLPYGGLIKTGPNQTINISDELRAYKDKQNEDNTFGEFHRTLNDLYRVILSNEYIAPTKMDKLEQILRIIDDLRNGKEDYQEIIKTSIKGVPFETMIMSLPNKMDDTFKIDGVELDEYINNMYKEYSIVRYNSVESKPTNVELIKLTEDAKDVTSEYIFLTPAETNILVESSKEDLTSKSYLHQTIKNIINGIELAKSLKTLHAYDERISLVYDSINSSFKDDNLIKELYQAMKARYAKKEDQLDLVDANWDDFEVLFRNDLNELKERINKLSDDYFHSYIVNDDEIRNIEYEFIDLKRRMEEIGVSSNHELDDVNEKIKKIKIITNYSRENLSHDKIRSQDDIEHLEMIRDLEARKTATSAPEQAAIEVRIEKMDKEIEKKLENDLQSGLITQDYFNKHMGNDSIVKAA